MRRPLSASDMQNPSTHATRARLRDREYVGHSLSFEPSCHCSPEMRHCRFRPWVLVSVSSMKPGEFRLIFAAVTRPLRSKFNRPDFRGPRYRGLTNGIALGFICRLCLLRCSAMPSRANNILWSELRQFLPALGSLAFFSFVLALMYLIPSLYMYQLFERVFQSRSQETLISLAVIVRITAGMPLNAT